MKTKEQLAEDYMHKVYGFLSRHHSEYILHFIAGHESRDEEVAKLKEENEAMRLALDFYADHEKNKDQICCNNAVQVGEEEFSCCGSPITSYQDDGGDKAREVLAKYHREKV